MASCTGIGAEEELHAGSRSADTLGRQCSRICRPINHRPWGVEAVPLDCASRARQLERDIWAGGGTSMHVAGIARIGQSDSLVTATAAVDSRLKVDRLSAGAVKPSISNSDRQSAAVCAGLRSAILPLTAGVEDC